MRDDLKKAILRSFDIRNNAAEIQFERGVIDTGLRSQVTAGKHLDPLSFIIASDIDKAGISPDDIYTEGRDIEIPGWFRASKKWDILAFKDEELVTAIELKSIYGSYGNNLNNRAEEAIGEAVDAKYAVDRKLINTTIPPLFGYVLIVKKDDKSSSKGRKSNLIHFNTDSVFEETSYIERFQILCQRLRREGLFGAVWFVVVDPVNGEVTEPDPDLTYDKFIAEVRGKVSVFLS